MRKFSKEGCPPSVLGRLPTNQPSWFKGYEQTYLERDIRTLSQVRDLTRFRDFSRLVSLRTGQILKQSELACDAKMNAVMTHRYLSLLETSFLIYRPPPYLRNRASRLIKASKLYFTDSGIAGHLAGIKTIGELQQDLLKGSLVETYVAQNFTGILSAKWPEANLHYWNVQGRYEVDFVIVERRKTLAVEVKWAGRWSDEDLSGLKAYFKSDPNCTVGILAYHGSRIVSLGKNLWAVPLGLVMS